jgi:hypothetical protein
MSTAHTRAIRGKAPAFAGPVRESELAERWRDGVESASGSQSITGVFADDTSKTLWACSNDLSALGGPSGGGDHVAALKGFDLKTGVAKRSVPLPGAYPPGATNSAASPVRELARTMPPSPSRPINSVPSSVEVMLSGNAFAPGSPIDRSSAYALIIPRADENSATVTTICAKRSAETKRDFNIDLSVVLGLSWIDSVHANSGAADFGIATVEFLRFKFGAQRSTRAGCG